jgi:hypothetical protein
MVETGVFNRTDKGFKAYAQVNNELSLLNDFILRGEQ